MTEETKSIYEFVRFKHLNIHTIINHLLIINLHHVYIYIYVCINDTRYLSCANHVRTIYIYIYTCSHLNDPKPRSAVSARICTPMAPAILTAMVVRWFTANVAGLRLGVGVLRGLWVPQPESEASWSCDVSTLLGQFVLVFGMVVSYHHMIKRARVPLHDSKNPKCFENWNMHIHANAG